MSKFPHLFAPLELRGVSLANRINMAPMVTSYATQRGEVTDRTIAYYSARARGGAGMITVEASPVSRNGRSFVRNLGIYEDAHIPGLRRLAEAIHSAEAKACIEIYHAGRRTYSSIIGSQPVAPSPVSFQGGEVPRELTVREIVKIQEDFAEAAFRAKVAGFDGVTIHAAHGYLINAFHSAVSNRRTDGYGGDLRSRARFGLEILERVRARVGDNFLVLCRLSGNEFLEEGITLEDAKQIAKWYEEAGADALDISAGAAETTYMMNQYMMFPRGVLVPLAAGIKEAVSIPVFAVGRINDPELAEQILAEGHADGISMGRALLADPELPNKAREGRLDDICPCIGCLQGCVDRLGRQLDIACLVNPAAGREQYVEVKPTPKRKKVLVVGGGIAGMQAAWTARRRGHEVELFERTPTLGGQFRLAGVAPSKGEVHNFLQFLARQLYQSGVTVRLSSEVTPAIVDDLAPDAVIVATGASPVALPLPGNESTLLAWDVLAGHAEVGEGVAVIGGGQGGCETAEYLAEMGKRVTVLEMLPEVAADMGPRAREPFLRRLAELGVDIITQARVTDITKGEITYDRVGLSEKLLGVDTVVVAIGSRAEAALAEALRNKSCELHVVGDCVKPRRCLQAVHEGFAAGAAV